MNTTAFMLRVRKVSRLDTLFRTHIMQPATHNVFPPLPQNKCIHWAYANPTMRVNLLPLRRHRYCGLLMQTIKSTYRTIPAQDLALELVKPPVLPYGHAHAPPHHARYSGNTLVQANIMPIKLRAFGRKLCTRM